jgi:hypothetical protein
MAVIQQKIAAIKTLSAEKWKDHTKLTKRTNVKHKVSYIEFLN